MQAKGRAFKYGDNVDTDVIIPARYLNSSDPAELATHCMEDIDKEFVNQVQKGDIVTTSGVGGTYPADVIIGQVQSVQKSENDISNYAVIKPYEDLTSVQDVFVVIDFPGAGDGEEIPVGQDTSGRGMRVEWNKVIRYLAYTLELLVLFMLQETPGLLPPLFGARPVLLFPAVITIAMFETEIPALAFGVVGGLFCDFGLSGTLGFHALVLGVLCFFISLLVRVYLQSNIATALLTGIVGIGLTVCLQWFFLYFFRYSHPSYAFTHHYLPKYCYTMLFVPLLYLLNRALSQALQPPER